LLLQFTTTRIFDSKAISPTVFGHEKKLNGLNVSTSTGWNWTKKKLLAISIVYVNNDAGGDSTGKRRRREKATVNMLCIRYTVSRCFEWNEIRTGAHFKRGNVRRFSSCPKSRSPTHTRGRAIEECVSEKGSGDCDAVSRTETDFREIIIKIVTVVVGFVGKRTSRRAKESLFIGRSDLCDEMFYDDDALRPNDNRKTDNAFRAIEFRTFNAARGVQDETNSSACSTVFFLSSSRNSFLRSVRGRFNAITARRRQQQYKR